MLLFFAFAVLAKKFNVIHNSPRSVLGLLTENDSVIRETAFGHTLELSKETYGKMKNHPEILNIEEDKPVRMATVEHSLGNQLEFRLQNNSPWGLARITGNFHSYEYIQAGGTGVRVYVLDTGIDIHHPEFQGRAVWGYNAVEDSPDLDEQGHGTHCAGVIGSKSFGVAKASRLVAVKVLDRDGTGSISRLIHGIDFVIKDQLRNPSPAGTVVSMSIGGEKSSALNHAVRIATVKYGIHFATAAGNEHRDACKYSPSSSSTALTVGASDQTDRVAKFSNGGECVDIYAPGVEIESTWPGNQTKTISGTSMATPHVAGIMAVYLSLADFTGEELKKRMRLDAENVVGGNLLISGLPLASFNALYWRIKRVTKD